jgi:F-type H+-transporting ATPase subunit epsilon
VKEIILSTNSGQFGVLPNHTPINTVVDMGPLRIRLLNVQWLTIVLWSGFARIVNNEIIILGNDAELGSGIDPEEAQHALEIVEADLINTEGMKELVEMKLALRRARLRVEAVNWIPHPIERSGNIFLDCSGLCLTEVPRGGSCARPIKGLSDGPPNVTNLWRPVGYLSPYTTLVVLKLGMLCHLGTQILKTRKMGPRTWSAIQNQIYSNRMPVWHTTLESLGSSNLAFCVIKVLKLSLVRSSVAHHIGIRFK